MFEIIVGIVALLFIIVGIYKCIPKHPTYDGQIVISVAENSKKLFSLELTGDPEELEKKDVVIFKVVSVDPPSGQ